MNIVKKFQNWNNTKLRKNVVKGIAGLVAFSVTYSLILPAITIDEETAENEPGIVLNENENSEEVLAGYEAPEEVTAEVPEEEPAVVEETPAEEVQEEAVEEPKEEAPEVVEETKEEAPAEAPEAEEPVVQIAAAEKLAYEAKDDYKFTVELESNSGLTEAAKLEIKEIVKEDEYANALQKAQKEFEDKIVKARFFEVKFLENEEVKNAAGKVTAVYAPAKAFELDDTQELTVVTLDKENRFNEIDEQKVDFKVNDKKTEEVKFETEELNEFAVIVTENIPEGYPAQDFEGKAGDVAVKVSAPEGAFPEGTTMSVAPVAEEKVIDQVSGAVEAKVGQVKAVDITFRDKDGNEIEPKKQIKVSMTSDLIRTAGASEIVHIDDEGKGSVVAQSDDKSADDEVIFESKDFSIYVIAETIETTYLTADGGTYKITVNYTSEAGVPDGATLEVNELTAGSKEYTGYVEQAAKALADGEDVPFVNAARLFDISIMSDGKKVEPTAPVEVKIEYVNPEALNETSEVGAVHFKGNKDKAETEVLDVEVQGEEGKVDGISFTTDSFSIYAVVIIDKEAGTFVIEDENYKVTITYTKEANIPIGTEMTVSQVDPESTHYGELKKEAIAKINDGVIWADHDFSEDPRKGITDAVFFDISLKYNDTEIEPDVPLSVKIEYKNFGILVPDDEETNIIHFSRTGTEIIDDVNVELSPTDISGLNVASTYEYQQDSFSEVGTYSTGKYIENLPVSSGVRALAVPSRAASEITASKDITDVDRDGVYELALSVTGQSESDSSTSVTKSNVVLVIDTSGSMNTPVSYSPYTYNASTYDSNTQYYGYYNNEYIEVWRNGGNWYRTRTVYTNGYVSYSNVYNGPLYDPNTRLEETKAAAITLVDALLGNNKNETTADGTNLNDIIEISLVTFAGSRNNDTYGYLRTYNNTHFTGTTDSTSATQLKNYIQNLTATGGTNWEQALKAAKTSADTYSNQTDEKTSVIFLTDGMPTLYGSNDSGTGHEIDGDGSWQNPYNRNNVHTSWTNARDEARTIVTSGYTLYNIFAFGKDEPLGYDSAGANQTDADYLRALTNYAYTGSGSYTNTALSDETKDYFYNASDTTSLQNAFQAIINKINNTVGYGGVEVDDGVTVGVTNTSVTVDGSINTNSFKYAIKSGNTTLATVSINGNTATFKSGTTDDTATVTGVSKTVNINGTDHTNTVFTAEIDGLTLRIAPATMDSNGKVIWELAPIEIIENGYTYELTFDVWPNQFAYDMVADLNNGVKTLADFEAIVKEGKTEEEGNRLWEQISNALVSLGNGKYAIRTNYEQYVDYYTVDTTQEEGQDPVTTYTPQPRKELGPKDPVNLTSSTMELRKIWDDSLDEDQLNELLWGEDFRTNPVSTKYGVKFHVWMADTLTDLQAQIDNYSEPNSSGSYADADEHDYLDKTLGWNEGNSEYEWSKDLEVAPGTMIEVSKAQEMGIDVSTHTQVTYGSKTYVVLESGHYYTVTEENIDRHFELNTIVYHPMLVDGVLSNVTFNEDGTVKEIIPMSSVDANNTLKGGINVQKKVFDGEGNEVTEVITSDDTFKVKITMNKADGTPYEDWDYRIYYGQNNPDGSWDETNQNYGRTGHVYGEAGNDGVIEVELYIGDVIRIVNVPAGVTYTVEETEYDDTVYSIGENYSFPLTTGGEEKTFTTDGSGVSYMISKGENDNFVVDPNKKVVGNAASQAIVVNKVPTAKVKLLKVGNTTTPLDGVKFKIYYDEECTKQVTKDATGQAIPGIDSDGAITTDANGYANLGTLAGTYYIKEISTKSGYNLLAAPIKVTVEKNGDAERVTASCTQGNVVYNTPEWIFKGDDGVWVVKVNNSTGAALPHTGGTGTLPYTLGGLTLIMIALVYGFVMRRRERRLND